MEGQIVLVLDLMKSDLLEQQRALGGPIGRYLPRVIPVHAENKILATHRYYIIIYNKYWK